MNNYAIMFFQVNKTQYAEMRKAFQLLTRIGIEPETAAEMLMDAHMKRIQQMKSMTALEHTTLGRR